MNKLLTLQIEESQNGLMVKTVLREYGLSRREISRLKFTGGLLLNKETCRVTETVKAGDQLELHFTEHDEAKATRLAGKPHILYEDEDVVVVDKPAGMPAHPSHEHLEDDMGTLLANWYAGQPFTIRAVGRLDKDVSGIMVYAKNQPACARLSRQRDEDALHKEYFAIVEGHFSEKKGTLQYRLAKLPHRKDRVVRQDGKLCITEYEVVKEYAEVSLVKIHLITGRTHQIRAGMAYYGHPLLGDRLYGGRDCFYRPALHCGYLSFLQPFTKKQIELHLDIPEEMRALLR